MNRLLILACSQRKAAAMRPMSAINRYDGPAFRVLRRYLREHPSDDLAVFILSARYGLIPGERLIADYDTRLNPERAARIRPRVLAAARQAVSSERPRTIGICAGRHYRLALAGVEDLLPANIRVDLIQGGQGVRLAALKRWLVDAG